MAVLTLAFDLLRISRLPSLHGDGPTLRGDVACERDHGSDGFR